MALGGTIGAAGSLVPATSIFNIKGEQGVSYDAAGRIAFTGPGGVAYTPSRVDTLIIQVATDQNAPQPATLNALVAGATNIANADAGALVTALVALPNQNRLPTNFGPGAGEWDGPTGQFRIVAEATEDITVAAVATGIGSVVARAGATTDATVVLRNFHGEALTNLTIRLSVEHSVQG